MELIASIVTFIFYMIANDQSWDGEHTVHFIGSVVCVGIPVGILFSLSGPDHPWLLTILVTRVLIHWMPGLGHTTLSLNFVKPYGFPKRNQEYSAREKGMRNRFT